MRNVPLIVEFAGLPGAGKSTIAKALIDHLSETEYNCYFHFSLTKSENSRSKNPFRKLVTFYKFLYAFLRHPTVAINTVIYIVRTKPFKLARFQRLSKLLLKLGRTKKLIKKNYDILILDQGILQNIWSLSAIGNPPGKTYPTRLIKSTFDVIKYAFVFVDVDATTAVVRMNYRLSTDSRFDKLSPSHSLKILKNQKDYFKQIISDCNEIEGMHHLTICGNDPIEKNIDIVKDFVEQTWKNSRSKMSKPTVILS